MEGEIERILGSDERILWEDKMNRKVLNVFLIIGLIVTISVGGLMMTKDSFTVDVNEGSHSVDGTLVGLGFMGIGVLFSVIGYFKKKVQRFAITQKRVVIKRGLIGTDFKSITFDEIENLEVDVNLVGKIFDVGTVKIDIGKTRTYSTDGVGDGEGTVETKTMYTNLFYIDNPYEVYQQVQDFMQKRKENLYSGNAGRQNRNERRRKPRQNQRSGGRDRNYR